uniref:ATP synthase F0 subunit 6 n=1 Tax=Chrysopetalum debile TaxID=115833 RepID=UPI001EDD76A3|nr:ATP synthase F0 subunit 6 [Chrysopetalum debile]UJV31484.1 ATP synthase F0 subunit 6 [Chrysopetalum debile]
MMTDIFSSFDPFIYSTSSSLSPLLFWSVSLLSISLTQSSLWVSPNSLIWSLYSTSAIMFNQTKRTFGYNLKGIPSILAPLFSFIILINLLGLLPYVFSYSSHLIFTLSFGLPLWLGLIFSSITYAPTSFAAGLLPAGAPDWLNPFLVLVETLSNLVRPITLSFRLAANMSAGHIVLGLIGIYSSAALFLSFYSFLFLFSIQVLYIIFELGICAIQAYIFCLLITLYSDDHPTQ